MRADRENRCGWREGRRSERAASHHCKRWKKTRQENPRNFHISVMEVVAAGHGGCGAAMVWYGMVCYTTLRSAALRYADVYASYVR